MTEYTRLCFTFNDLGKENVFVQNVSVMQQNRFGNVQKAHKK